MKRNTAIILGTSAIGLGYLAWYGKKQYDLINETIWFDYDKESVRVIKLGLEDTRINLDYIIDNRGEFVAEVKEVNIAISSNGVPITKVQRSGDFSILPNTKVPFEITLRLNPTELIRNSKDLNIMNYKEMPLTFKGSIKVKKMGIWIPIPINFTYKLREFL